MKNKLLKKGDAKTAVKNTGTYAILFCSLIAMAFFGVCTPSMRSGGDLSGPAGSVNGDEISYFEFVRAYSDQSEQMRRRHGENFNPSALQIARSVLDRLLSDRVLYHEALRLGLTTPDDEVVRSLKEVKQFRDKDGKFSSEIFQNYLNRFNYTERTFLEDVRRGMTIQKLREFILNTSYVSSKAVDIDYVLSETKFNIDFLKFDPATMNVDIPDKEVEEFLKDEAAKTRVKTQYEASKTDYESPEKVNAQHILISFMGARNAGAEIKRSKEEAMKRAEDLAKQAKEAKDFSALAQANTDEPAGKKSGGSLGFFTRESMVKPFSDAAFALKPGEVSNVVETQFGYHIIKAIGHQDAKVTTLEQATPSIVRSIIRKDRGGNVAEAGANDTFAALKDNKGVDDKLKALGVSWEETGEFAANARFLPKIGSQPEVFAEVLTLKVPGQIGSKVLVVGKTRYIIRLKERKAADVHNLSVETRKSMAQSSAFSSGYTFFTTFESKAVERFEKSKDVYRNPAYLALDQAQEDQGGGMPFGGTVPEEY